MAPFLSLLTLFALALSTTVLASPHISRHVHNHAHRAIAIDNPKRSLNKRCTPRPSNATSSALPTSSALAAPINVAPVPSLPPSSPPAAPSSSPTSYYVQTTSQAPTPTTTSTPPPPATSSTPPPPPATSSTPPPPPATSSTPPPAQTSSSSSNSGLPSYMTGTQYGQGTYYEVGLGACGATNIDTQLIVAVSHDLFDTYPAYDGTNPNTNPVCGKQIVIDYQGQSVKVTVQDRCAACSITSLDLSPTAFSALALQSIGRIDISWYWA